MKGRMSSLRSWSSEASGSSINSSRGFASTARANETRWRSPPRGRRPGAREGSRGPSGAPPSPAGTSARPSGCGGGRRGCFPPHREVGEEARVLEDEGRPGGRGLRRRSGRPATTVASKTIRPRGSRSSPRDGPEERGLAAARGARRSRSPRRGGRRVTPRAGSPSGRGRGPPRGAGRRPAQPPAWTGEAAVDRVHGHQHHEAEAQKDGGEGVGGRVVQWSRRARRRRSR